MQEITDYSEELLPLFQHLMKQLTSTPKKLTPAILKDVIDDCNTHLYLLKDKGNIIGTITLVENKALSGKKIWMEDFIIDEQYRGKGWGKQLLQLAIKEAQQLNADSINLTSKPSRIAANALYMKTGFIKRATNIYRMPLKMF